MKFKLRDRLNANSKVLLSNFVSLSILQGLNFLLPLLTLPFLFKTLGAEYFGLLAFSTAFISYFQIIIDFGFNLSGTREISINREDKNTLNEIYSSVLFIKFLLSLLSLLIVFLIVNIITKFELYSSLYYCSFLIVLGQAFFSTWFFQGIEKMKYITIISVVSKSLFTIAIFVFVTRPSDYLLVPIFTGIGNVICAIVSFLIIRLKYNVQLVFVDSKKMKYYFTNSFPLFISNLSVTLYTFTTVVLLGFFTNNVFVGYYTVAERIVAALKSIIGPVAQTFYPYLSRKSIEDKEVVFKFNRFFLKIAGIIMIMICSIIFFFSSQILQMFFGEDAQNSNLCLKIMAFIPVFVICDTVFATFTLLVFGKNKIYSMIVTFAGLLNIILVLILVPNLKHIGAAISLLLCEFVVFLLLLLYVLKNKLFYFKSQTQANAK